MVKCNQLSCKKISAGPKVPLAQISLLGSVRSPEAAHKLCIFAAYE